MGQWKKLSGNNTQNSLEKKLKALPSRLKIRVGPPPAPKYALPICVLYSKRSIIDTVAVENRLLFFEGYTNIFLDTVVIP